MESYKHLVYLSLISCVFGLTVSKEVKSLCSLSKFDNNCLCVYRTNGQRYVPELFANCKWNDFKVLPEFSRFPEDLYHLDISHNVISVLEADFRNGHLAELILSYNRIDHITYTFFNYVPNLEVLDLSHNTLSILDSKVFSRITKLLKLDLSYNKLTVLSDDVLTPLINLQDLNLGYNKVGEFLEKSSNIFDGEFGLTSNLTNLNLDRVGLNEIKNTFFGSTKLLTHLSLADNYFDEVPNIPTSVKYFDFSGNNVTMLSVRHLNYHSLKTLKLNRLSNLESIDRYAFYNMQELEELYMEDCERLREFNSLAFGVLAHGASDVNLKKLSFARSGLKALNDTYFHLFRKLDYINLQDNPWTCDCGILWMHLLNDTFHDTGYMRCLTPTNLRNRKIMDLTSKHLPNCMVSSKSQRLQKYLIPILGVAIILLLFLIIYLIYMGPLLYKNYRGIGPESPYQEVTVLREYQNK